MPAAITIETSYAAMSRDMGSSHITAHAGQHKYLMDGEDPVDYLLPNDEVTPIVEQAIKAGVKSGQLRSKSEWEKYNKSIRKDRRLDSYFDYVKKVCSNASQKLYRDFDKALQDPKLPKSKRSLIATEFNSLASHQDIPIVGTLFYFGDAGEFEQAKQDACFEQLKQADKMAGNIFFKSTEFQCLHPQIFKLERHSDEAGRPHLQAMETCFTTSYRSYKTKNGSVQKRIDSYGRTKYQLDGLIRYFGSKEKVDQQLDRLIELQQQSQNQIKKNDGNRIGLVRPEATMLMDNFNPEEAQLASDKINRDVKPKTLERLRRQTIAQLTRVIDFSAMAKAKAKAYEHYKLPAKYSRTNINYTTDGQHLTAEQYRLKMNATDQGKTTVDQAKAIAIQTKKSAEDEADTIIKKAHKQAKNIVDQAKEKQAEAEQTKAEALYDEAKVNHRVHMAEMRLVDLNRKTNDQNKKLKQQQKQLKQTQLKLKQQQEQHSQLLDENSKLTDEINQNNNTVKSINGLRKQAKAEGLSVNDVIADRSKLVNQLRLTGKAYAAVERTARLVISLMTGNPIGYKNEENYKYTPSERAFSAGITLNNYENEFTTTAEKKSMNTLPIILTKKAAHWLEQKYVAKFHQSPYWDQQKPKELKVNINHTQNTDEHIPD